MAIPPYSGYNIVDWHIYNRLRGLWKTESRSWSEGERRDFVEWVPKAHVTERENSMLDHPLAEYMRCNRHSWGHFVILRVMFGASQCARQSWWAEFKQKYERAAEDAPPGVVPRGVDEVLLTNRMDPPPMMKIPTMEVNSVHVESDWIRERNVLAGRAYTRGEGETCEDRARRSEREQGVEPEEAQDNESEDERAGAVTQVSSLRERSTVVCTDGTSRGLKEVVVEQGEYD
ncbi:hypothetical protein TrVGV298_011386 [Trichoderma virens]|nr:hypothetical protein TrVGV298_011386 [Trichoderma virens]